MSVDESSRKVSFFKGVETGFPLIFSAIFFGLIFGFTGASGGLKLYFVSAMSYIIFAGSAQFITLILIIEHETVLAIIFAAVIINLRHLLYGLVLNPLLTFKGIKRAFLAYFITDEAFLVTTIVEKEELVNKTNYSLDYVLLGAGVFLWSSWNLATIAGYLLYQFAADFVVLPENFVIAASFVGFLTDQFVNYPADRGVIIISILIALIFGHFLGTSSLLVVIMIIGAIVAMLKKYISYKEE